MIRLVMADDHPIIRDGLKQFFAEVGGIEVVAEAKNGTETLEAVGCGGFDLLLLDMTMPGPSGFELISLIRARQPALPILVLSIHNEPMIVRHALRAGATGYITKGSALKDLLAAIHHVAQGTSYVDPTVAQQIGFASEDGSPDLHKEKFTELDFEVLRMMNEGFGSRDIAEALCIDIDTATTHVARLRRLRT